MREESCPRSSRTSNRVQHRTFPTEKQPNVLNLGKWGPGKKTPGGRARRHSRRTGSFHVRSSRRGTPRLVSGERHSSNRTPRPETAGKEAIDESDHVKIKHIRTQNPSSSARQAAHVWGGEGPSGVRLGRPRTGQRHGAPRSPQEARAQVGASNPQRQRPDVRSKDTLGPTSNQRSSKYSYNPFTFQTIRNLKYR